MCYGCWSEYGKPAIDSAQVRAAAALIDGVYAYSPGGGNLHIELDDWNLGDRFFRAFEPYRADVPAGQLEVEQRCFAALQALSVAERASALALHEGYWK